MKDFFLKFESKEQADSILYEITPEVIEDDIITPEIRTPKFQNIDVIGDIWRPTGEMKVDENGMEIPVMELIPGFHVNLRVIGEDTSAVESFAVVPKNPMRVWA